MVLKVKIAASFASGQAVAVALAVIFLLQYKTCIVQFSVAAELRGGGVA